MKTVQFMDVSELFKSSHPGVFDLFLEHCPWSFGDLDIALIENKKIQDFLEQLTPLSVNDLEIISIHKTIDFLKTQSDNLFINLEN